MKKSVQVLHKGFTLVELLIVIAIIAILAAVVVLIINPLEITKRGRDAARLSDLANLQNAINVTVQESTGATGMALFCNGAAGSSCTGTSVGGGQQINGGGWVKINLSNQTSVQVPTLPVDPLNTAGATGFHYIYCGDASGWKMITALESQQQAAKQLADGGTLAQYETGSQLGMACTY